MLMKLALVKSEKKSTEDDLKAFTSTMSKSLLKWISLQAFLIWLHCYRYLLKRRPAGLMTALINMSGDFNNVSGFF